MGWQRTFSRDTRCSGNFCNLCIVFTSENYSLRTAVSPAVCVLGPWSDGIQCLQSSMEKVYWTGATG